jgi:succinate dehydrogenase hydrophobic anchor subunit
MATRTDEDYSEATRWRRRPRPTFAWLAQAVSGALLLVLLTVHMVAQHFVVAGGLRGYDDVVAWIRNPVVFATEALLLVCVTWHGIAGVGTILYGLFLLATIASRGPV